MKEENPKVWWKEVKRLCGFNSNSGNVSSHIHIEGIENLTDQELTNAISEAFLEPLEEYRLSQPLTKLRIDEDTPELPKVSDMRIFKLLTALTLPRRVVLTRYQTGCSRTTLNGCPLQSAESSN